jgi:hypothetical protein
MQNTGTFEVEPSRQRRKSQPVVNTREAEQQHLANVSAMADYERGDQLQEQLKKNLDFVQFTRKGMAKLSKLRNGLSHALFHYLAKEMGKDNTIIVSQQTLAQIMDTSRISINTAIRELETHELLQICKVGNQNIYCLNAAIVWTQERDKLHLARFRAAVIISDTEQAKIRKTTMKQISLKLDD